MSVWLCQIAKNTYFNYQAKHAKSYASIDVQEDDAYVSSDRGFDELFMRKEDALLIHKIVHAMREPYKEIFTLRVFGELSFAENSQLFDKSESWARVTFYRAKQSIYEKLKGSEKNESCS